MYQPKWKEKVWERNLKIIFGIKRYNSEKKTKHDWTVVCTMSNLFWGERSSRDQSKGLQGSQTSLSSRLVLYGYRRPIDIQETRSLQKLERWYSIHFIHFMMNCYFYLLKWYAFLICFFFSFLFCFFFKFQ